MNIIAALQQINNAADSAYSRSTQSRPTYEQTKAHNNKASQAEDYIAARCPSKISSYPIIEAEVNATKKLPCEAAREIIKRRNEYLHPSDKIEAMRNAGKKKVYENDIDIEEAVNNIIKELDQI